MSLAYFGIPLKTRHLDPGGTADDERTIIRHLLRTGENAHTSAMSLKNAAVLALIGTLLLTFLLAADFVRSLSGFLNDIVPSLALLRSLIYLVASLSVTVFFYVFDRTQSR